MDKLRGLFYTIELARFGKEIFMSKQKRKFNRSQAAHRRLAKKHHAAAAAAKKRGEYHRYDIHSRKARYHNEAEFTQRRLGRILTPEEKTNVFNKVVQIIGKFFRGISTPKRKTKKKQEERKNNDVLGDIKRGNFNLKKTE